MLEDREEVEDGTLDDGSEEEATDTLDEEFVLAEEPAPQQMSRPALDGGTQYQLVGDTAPAPRQTSINPSAHVAVRAPQTH